MTSKEFNKQFITICKKNKAKQLDQNSFEIETIFGKLWMLGTYDGIISKSGCIFMRFKEPQKFNLALFFKCFSKYEVINKHSYKWNLHSSNTDYILNELDERLSNLNWLNEKPNLKLVAAS